MFSNNLKQLRKERGLTQKDLADALGIAKSTISMYENNNREPDFETEELIADFFNVDINTLRGKKTNLTPTTLSDDDIKFALFGGDGVITDEMYEEVKQFAKFIKEREKKENE